MRLCDGITHKDALFGDGMSLDFISDLEAKYAISTGGLPI